MAVQSPGELVHKKCQQCEGDLKPYSIDAAVLRSPTIVRLLVDPQLPINFGGLLPFANATSACRNIPTICSAPCRFFIANPFRPYRPVGFSHIPWIRFREGGQDTDRILPADFGG
jgi:hypothetical protein